ncbi:Baeyer-Villiger monooxygenase [Aspergillus unguis]
MGSIGHQDKYDVIIVGAGFGGCYLLDKLRQQSIKALVIERGSDIGGVWHWNCYPGARVDTKIPLYEFSNEKIWKDWTWTEKYPGVEEIRRYFEHVEEKLHLKKDILFNTEVTAASFNADQSSWTITINDGAELACQHFILCTGFASKPFIPNFQGLNTFAGPWFHTSKWPQSGIDYAGKKVAVVGNGSSGIQVIQEIGPSVKHLTVFQRSPTFALPMRQDKLLPDGPEQNKSKYADLYKLRKQTFAGIDKEFNPKAAADVSPEERQEFFERIWAEGGLSFWLATYKDIITDRESNRHAYEFWRSKVLPRIKDPKAAALLAPVNPPYYFGTKRATLEQRYYEIYNQENVTLVDASTNPITSVTPKGVQTADGTIHEVDILVLATGFDSVTGGILNIDIQGSSQSLKDKWAKGTWTNLGLMTAGFPNMFFLYGPQGPTSFCNGPTCAEVQGDWIVETIKFMREKGYRELEPTTEAEDKWREHVNMVGNVTLLPETRSEYMGTNIPGKPKEMLNYLGGLTDYIKRIESTTELGYPGFVLQ